MWYNINDTHLFAKNGERAGRALRLFGKRRGGGEAACAVPILAEPPKGGERSEPQCGICTFFRRRRWEKCERGKHRKSRRAPFLAECAGSCSACGGTRLSPSFCPLPLSLTARFPGILQLPAKLAHFLPHGSAGALSAPRQRGRTRRVPRLRRLRRRPCICFANARRAPAPPLALSKKSTQKERTPFYDIPRQCGNYPPVRRGDKRCGG